MSAPRGSRREAVGRWLEGPRGRLALGVFLVAGHVARPETWDSDPFSRLMGLVLLLVGCYLVGSVAARDEVQP